LYSTELSKHPPAFLRRAMQFGANAASSNVRFAIAFEFARVPPENGENWTGLLNVFV
jgi:hypothetical protein